MTDLDTHAHREGNQISLPAPSKPCIILVRHGRPALDRSKLISFREYRAWWRAYDAGGLAEDQTPTPRTRAMVAHADVIYASTLRRAQETADWLFPDRTVISDPDLVEAPLPPPLFYGLRLRPGLWGVFARMSWWLGFSGGLEGRAAVERRVDRAADRLIEAAGVAGSPQVVAVCAHGWFNRMMRPALMARGWRCMEDGGDRYWSYRLYAPLPS